MTYVAEFHENLRQVRAFITLTGVPAGASVEALIDEEELDTVHLRCGDVSVALKLPVKAASAGPLDVQWSGTYYELKTATVPNSTRDPFSDDAESKRDMLSAPHLIAAAPTSFICASCSLPLVQGSKVTDYRDLPSEHWAELVEAWMCHSDQKLNKEIMQHANGFEPESGRALVGGSYILFNRENVVTANLVDYEQSKVSGLVYLLFLRAHKKVDVGSTTGGCVICGQASPGYDTRALAGFRAPALRARSVRRSLASSAFD
jgi:hypothetical protein